MKKLLNYSIILIIILLQACEEKGVFVELQPREDFDTTYMAPVETAQPRNVLIEEFTGASCTNCPQGHELVASLISSNPDRIVAIAYHTFSGGKIFAPVNKSNEKSVYDFRDSNATLISTDIYGGLSSIPKAGIDRISVSASRQIDKGQWSLNTSNRLPVPTAANMYLTSSYNEQENKVTVKVKIAYTKEVTTKNALTIGIIENNIIDAQEYPDSVDMHYNHSHVFRKCLTSHYGKSILDTIATKSPGRVYEYTYTFTLPSAPTILNPDNCKVVAFLSNSDDKSDNKEVMQAKEVKLK